MLSVEFCRNCYVKGAILTVLITNSEGFRIGFKLKVAHFSIVLLIKLCFLQATHHMCIPLHFKYRQAFPMVASGAQDKLQFA